jgi:hypothetical protein
MLRHDVFIRVKDLGFVPQQIAVMNAETHFHRAPGTGRCRDIHLQSDPAHRPQRARPPADKTRNSDAA